MKNYFFLSGLFLLLISCAKTVEQAQENLVLRAMTDGEWRMTNFTKAGIDKTIDFESYRFRFQSDNTVNAVNNGVVERTGTWAADAAAQTITAAFGNSGALLALLNGTWKVTKNSWTFVEASQTVNNEVLTLRIDK